MKQPTLFKPKPLLDTSPMPFGKFKGDKMQNVPTSYLLWLYKNNKCFGMVKNYIIDNLQVLDQE